MRLSLLGLLFLSWLNSCSSGQSWQDEYPWLPGQAICATSEEAYGRIEEGLRREGVDSLYYDRSVIVARDPESLFRARRVIASLAEEVGHEIVWMADIMPYWELFALGDELWTVAASVDLRAATAEEVLARLEAAGIPCQVHFGESFDIVIVRGESAVRAEAVLRQSPLPGVRIHAH